MRSGRCRWIVAIVAWMGTSVIHAISNSPNNGNGYFPNPQSYSLLHQHVSFDPQEEQLHVSAETEALTFYDSSSDVSVLPHREESSFVSMECLYQGTTRNDLDLFKEYDVDEEYEVDEEDDDDDDNDGHNMMLSNVSMRRSFDQGTQPNDTHSPISQRTRENLESRRNKAAPVRSSKLSLVKSPKKRSKHAFLTLRGGAAVNIPGAEEFAKRLLVAALVTLLYEGSIGHLLEFVKIVMQTSPPGTTYADVLRTITADKGLVGIYDGFIPWGVIQSIGKGGVFGLARAVALSFLLPMVDSGQLSQLVALTLAGGIAGGFQGYVLSPTLLLKTRVMTNPIFREPMSLLKTTLLSLTVGFDVVNNEGFGALMKGSNVFALKRVFDWSTRFYFSDIFSNLIKTHLVTSDKLTAGQKIAADLLGGTASTLVTLPLDVLVAKSQDAKKAGVQVSAWSMFQEELKEKGWKGLYNSYMCGFEARLLHVCFTTVAMKTGTGVMYDFLFPNKDLES